MPVSKTEGKDEEFSVPPITTSPLTGVTGAVNWGGLNKFNSASRAQIADAEADELINFLPQLQALQQVPGPGPAFSTLPASVIWDFCEVLNGNLYSYHLCTNGHLYQVNAAGAQTDLSGTVTSTLSTTSASASATVGSATGLVIGMTISGNANIPAGTKITNISGTTLTLSQNASATASAVSTNFNLLFSTGTTQVDICPWQGAQVVLCDLILQTVYSWNGSAMSVLIPSLPANFVEVYAGRLWLANGSTLSWTAAGTNNSLAGDAGSFIIAEGQCNNPIIALQDFGGSLYVFGSNWIKTINSLNDVGSPAVLTFQQPLLTTQVSIINKWSIIPFGTDLFFANVYGIWRLEGAVPVKISAVLDGFFVGLQSANCSWSAAYGQVLGMPCLFWQFAWTGDGANAVFGYTANQQWFRVIPNAPTGGTGAGSVARIFGQVSSSTANNTPIVYYTDGTNLYNLFGGPAATVTSTFNSKLWSFYSIMAFDMFTEFGLQFVINSATTLTIQELDSSGVLSGPNGSFGLSAPSAQSYSYNPNLGQWQNNASTVGNWINAAAVQGNWSGIGKQQYVFEQAVIPYQERNMAVNLTFVSSGLVLQALVVSYRKLLSAKG